jgi:hypothetical protein
LCIIITISLFGRGNGKGKIGVQSPEYAEIPGMISDRLMSEHDQFVLSAILSIMQEGKKYRPSEVVDRLAEVLRYPHGEEVIRKAGDALIEKLKNGIHFEDVQFTVTSKLGKRTELNAKLFLKMLDRLPHKAEIKKLAIEMLASFRGVELKPELVDEIEMALLQRMMDPQESDCVKKAITDRFWKEGKGRPEIRVSEARGDETQLLQEQAPGKAFAAAKSMRDAQTQGLQGELDRASGFLMMIRDGNPLQKERAAMALIKVIEISKSRDELVRIRDGVAPLKMEFPTLYRTVLKAMQGMLHDGPSSKPPIALGTGSRLVFDRNTPTVPPLDGAANRNTPTVPPLKR